MILALIILASLPVLWVFFLAYSALLATWETLSLEVKIVGAAFFMRERKSPCQKKTPQITP